MSNSGKIKDLPLEEQPRERLYNNPLDTLSTADLLAILIGHGTKEKSALQLAYDLLIRFESISHLADASIEELCLTKGIGKVKAVTIKAAFGLGKRVNGHESSESPVITHPRQVYSLLKNTLAEEKRETLIVLLLNTKRKLIRQVVISQGTLTQTLIHPREVFHPAIKYHAQAIILAHNHPSGDPTPSKEDVEVTKEIKEVGRLLNIPLLDHIVVAKDGYQSINDIFF